MRTAARRMAVWGWVLLVLCPAGARGEVRLDRLMGDGMVVQREMPIKIHGWAESGEQVTVTLAGQTSTAQAGQDGRWVVTLEPQKAGGPHVMVIQGENEITINDVLIGDVWLCSGQSNMELPMRRVQDRYPDVIANCTNPQIRHFEVPDRYDFHAPREDLEWGQWKSADPENIMDFSAVAYFFARELYAKYGVPIGLINCALGGSPAEAWISEEGLTAFPEHLATAKKFRDDAFVKSIIEHDRAISSAWYQQLDKLDKGQQPGRTSWFDPACDVSDWDTMDVPGYWADGRLGPVNGVVWFRKEIEVPAAMVGKEAKLLLGRIVDADRTWVNGTPVGNVTYQYPPRRYVFGPGVLREGTNTIVVRVVNNSGRGGFVEDKPYELIAGGRTIDLRGPWKYKLGAVMDPLPGQTFVQWQPLGLYNGMIAPLIQTPIKGVIWYQGESNTARPSEYRPLMKALIADWRAKWGQGDFPFLFVQLANFMEAKEQPSESGWAEVREAQLKTLEVPNTAMAVTIDLGEWNDIHPLNKEDVGKRLALAARKVAYGDDAAVWSGPIYESMQVEGGKAVLSFSHTGSGLICKGDMLKEFAIAGPDKRFVWAEAKIEGDQVVVWSDKVTEPVAVRYAWADNPAGANLYNREGLPASPFRTDE